MKLFLRKALLTVIVAGLLTGQSYAMMEWVLGKLGYKRVARIETSPVGDSDSERRGIKRDREELNVQLTPQISTSQWGLTNFGNTCYFNASVQLLNALPDFVNQIKRARAIRAGSPCERAIKNSYALAGTPQDKIDEQYKREKVDGLYYVDVFKEFFVHSCPQNLHALYQKLCKKVFSNDEMYEQEDPHQLLLPILQSMQYVGIDRFNFMTSSCRLFNECKHQSTSKTVQQILELPLPRNVEQVSLNKLFGNYFRPDIVNDKDVLIECSTCKQKQSTTNSVLFESLPKTLVMKLNRFALNKETKILTVNQCNVSLPEVLTVRFSGSEYDYALTGVIYRHGNRVNSAHYTASVMHASGVWYHCDDDIVTTLSEKDKENVSNTPSKDGYAYILMYNRVGVQD